MAYSATSWMSLQSAVRPGERAEVYGNIQQKPNNRKPNRPRETISHTRSTRSMSPQRSIGGRRDEIDAENEEGVASLTNNTQAVVTIESADTLYNVQNCRTCLAQSHNATKCPSISQQLRTNLMQNCKENVNPLLKCKLLFYTPMYGHFPPSPPDNKHSTPPT